MILSDINIQDLKKPLDAFWKLASEKALLLHKEYDTKQGSPVFTVHGKYTTRGWTEWTQGFQYGIPLLIAEATSNKELLKIGKENTFNNMAHHLSHFGVHDHGFNNLSTYGNLLRMANQNLFDASKEEKEYYKLALRMSASVQAKRWTNTKEGGFIYSFNGPHSLFIDTIRTARIVLAGHKLKHRLLDENDTKIDLLQRAIEHALTTA
ncbi:MAG: glycosyl hydrolase, partial [Polaribacter sp.]|nr:glycosyl hydrolase [Polaribacter sp.]